MGVALREAGVPLRIGFVNVGSLRGKDGEVVNMAVEGRSGLLLSPGNKMERGGC